MKVTEYLPHASGYAPPSPSLPPFEAALPARHRADLHGVVARNGETIARASLWYHRVPPYGDERLGVIGHFDAADEQCAEQLLSWAATRLAAQGCTMMVGPMDGNTWRRYRFVTDTGSEPVFFLEPANPAVYPRYFQAQGFTPLAEYTSAVVDDLGRPDPRIARAVERLKALDVIWRPLDTGRFEEELRVIYRLSLKSFSRNLLYTPIEESEFLDQYETIAPYLVPDLTLLAERHGELLGYLFGIPDYRQSRQLEAIDTFIIKTVAVATGRSHAGLGSVLVAECQRIARERGYRRAIHALMHDGNRSRNISARYARTMRRYTLYKKRLVPA